MANYNTAGLGSMLNGKVSLPSFGNGGSGAVKTASGGVPQSGYQIASFSSITLGTAPVPTSVTNIKAPNGYPMSNVQVYLSLTDTTGNTTAPVTPATVEKAIQQLQIVGSSGKPIVVWNGTFGEMTRWQQVLNDNGIYTPAPTPTDTVTASAYTSTWLISFKHLVIDPSEYPLTVTLLPNTLASRAATPNLMTSQINALTVSGDFVPVTGYVKTLYRTKQVSDSSTGYFDLGQNIDNAVCSVIAADYGADSNLNSANTFYIASNNNTLIPYTSYNAIISAQNALPSNGTNAQHISGFFPIQVLYKAAIDGTQNIKFLSNISSAPTGGGQSNTINLYEAEQYN